MSLSTQQHADLASDAYTDRKTGVRRPNERDFESINGTTYRILEHVNNPRTGYAGTVYQRVDTGDIVVAHRGTEVDQGIAALTKDGVLADGRMVVNRSNPQAPEAIELTRHAINRANDIGQEFGKVPQVTVTGHSLGGTHAQITAHHFGLQGETFNAYGAASLGLGIPRGGDAVTNHFMASDFVSAASPHYGEVRSYASREEVNVLQASGYENNDRFLFDSRSPGKAHGMLLGMHAMHNFTAKNGDGQPDRSIFDDPFARQRANDNVAMFEKFRDEQALARGVATTVATRLTPGLSGFDRDAVQASEPSGARGQREGTVLLESVIVPPLPEHLRDGYREPHTPTPARPVHQDDDRVVVPPLPAELRDAMTSPQASVSDPRTPGHPDHRLYQQIEAGVSRLDATMGRSFDASSERLAMHSLVGAKAAGITSADHVVMNQTGKPQPDGSQTPVGTILFIVQGQDPFDERNKVAQIPVQAAVQAPVEQSLAKLTDLTQQQALAQQASPPTQDDPSRGPRMV